MATMPSLFKLGSLLFPTEIQASCVVESASDLVAFVTLLLNQFDAAADVALDLISSSPSSTPSTPSSSARAALLGTARHAVHSTTWGLAIATFALFDLTLGLSFVAYWSAHHALAALAAALVPLTQTVMAVGPLGPPSSDSDSDHRRHLPSPGCDHCSGKSEGDGRNGSNEEHEAQVTGLTPLQLYHTSRHLERCAVYL